MTQWQRQTRERLVRQQLAFSQAVLEGAILLTITITIGLIAVLCWNIASHRIGLL